MTAAVKIFVKYPDDGKNFIQKLLEAAAYETENPDVRDRLIFYFLHKLNYKILKNNRAYIYWRMLSSDPNKTKETVLCEKPTIHEEFFQMESEFLEKMIDTLGLISSVYHKTPEELFPKKSR